MNVWSSIEPRLNNLSQKQCFDLAFKDINMTRQDVADALGINRSSYSRWVIGETKMRKDVLDMTIDYLKLRGCSQENLERLYGIPTGKGYGSLVLRDKYGKKSS